MATKAAERTHVTFQSDIFNKTEQHDYFVNPDCFGDDVCRFVSSKFQEHGVQCSEPVAQDWGWMLRIQFHRREFDFCTNYHMDGFWLAFVQSCSDFFRDLFGSADKSVPIELTCLLHEILTTSPGIRDIRWYDEMQFNKGWDDFSELPS